MNALYELALALKFVNSTKAQNLAFSAVITDAGVVVEKLKHFIMKMYDVHSSVNATGEDTWPGNSKMWYNRFTSLVKTMLRDEQLSQDIDDSDCEALYLAIGKSLRLEEGVSAKDSLVRCLHNLRRCLLEIDYTIRLSPEERVRKIYDFLYRGYTCYCKKQDEASFNIGVCHLPHSRRKVARRKIQLEMTKLRKTFHASGFLNPLCMEVFGDQAEPFGAEQYETVMREFYVDGKLDMDYCMDYVVANRFTLTDNQRNAFWRYIHLTDILSTKLKEWTEPEGSTPEPASAVDIPLSGIFDPDFLKDSNKVSRFISVMTTEICPHTSLQYNRKESYYKWWHIRHALIRCGLIESKARMKDVAAALAPFDTTFHRSEESIYQVLKGDKDVYYSHKTKLDNIDEHCISEIVKLLN